VAVCSLIFHFILIFGYYGLLSLLLSFMLHFLILPLPGVPPLLLVFFIASTVLYRSLKPMYWPEATLTESTVHVPTRFKKQNEVASELP